MKSLTFLIILFLSVSISKAQNNPDAILGKWMIDKGNCLVEVYKVKNEYRAKILWFDVKNKKPIDQWTDDKNPEPKLRSRKLLGMEVVNKLHFDPATGEWIDGVIYDATSGKKWDSIVWLTKLNQLKVKGYWVFKFLSQTKTFNKVT